MAERKRRERVTRHGINSPRKTQRVALAAGLLAVALLALAARPALGVDSHNEVLTTFDAGSGCSIYDAALDEANEWIYVSCAGGVRRFNYDGTPADFTAVKPHIEGNRLIKDPGGAKEAFNGRPQLAVDNSSSPNQGRLFVTSAPNVDIFEPDGAYFAPLIQPLENSIPNELSAIDVGHDGSIYVGSQNPGDRVSKYNPGLQEIKRFYGSYGTSNYQFAQSQDPCHLRVDNTGAMWLNHCDFFFLSRSMLSKYEVDQFTDELDIEAYGGGSGRSASFAAKPSPFVTPDPLLTFNPDQSDSFGQFDLDPDTNDLYVNRFNRIEIYSQGVAGESAYLKAPAFGTGALANSKAVAVDEAGRVFASMGNEIVVFGPGDILPDVHTFSLGLDDVGYTTAHVGGEVELAGGSDITECEFEYGLNDEYTGAGSGTEVCAPDPNSAPPGSNFDADTLVTADLTGLQTGETYHVRLTAKNASGENFGIDRTFEPPYVLKVQTLAAEEIDTDGAVLKGSFNPDGKVTSYRFDYGITTNYGFSTPLELGGSGVGEIEVEQELSSLPSGKVFHYRVVASNPEGETIGSDRTFRVGSSPEVSGARATEVAETSATLRASINPVGFATKYKFEYGTTPEYGQSVPADLTDIGSGVADVSVLQEIAGLQPGVTYHFRVVAENKWGTSHSPNTTFDYAPPGCPNDHVRQQTGASYLPDCRAYELVSPGAAGAILLFPGNAAASEGSGGEGNEGTFGLRYNEGMKYILNRGFAVAPSRFAFFGGFGTIDGIYAPITRLDMYMSTRTANGWVTTLPGLSGSEATQTGRKECSESMSLCIDHQEGQEGEYQREGAPYMFTAAGEHIGRLPTNVDVIPGGEFFAGSKRMSDDFGHLVFASTEFLTQGFPQTLKPGIPFAPGAVTTGVGSAYLNDIKNRTISIISRLQNGDDIPTDNPTPIKSIDFPGLSPDASHVLMSTRGPGKLKHLYMRVNDLVTHGIAGGIAVEPLGMTREGSEVLYATTAALSPADTDTSSDIYRWDEGTEEDTLLSGGATPGAGEPGNSDACSPTWPDAGAGCGARPLTPERAHPNANTAVSVPTAMDDLFAEESGTIYFYSSENLDPASPGILNQRNLYVYRDGDVHLVTTLDAGTQINRMQISPDGAHAAMVTRSRMTGYDNKGFAQMYTYDADTGGIQCASCNPTGAPPTTDVVASQGGRFMADDGRAFFSSKEALVPRDQNGRITDVYEYVGGRPQLLTSGLSARDFTGGSETISLLYAPEYTGLEAVSHDGTDVYFSTFETLVSTDHNGQFVKFYNARTGGGFDESPGLAPCAAADECHGVDSSRPRPPVITSGKAAPGGNHPVVKKKKAKKKKKKGRKKRKGNRGHGRQNRG